MEFSIITPWYVTIGNSDFCHALYLTGIHFRGELQHVGDVSEQKIKCRPIRTREIGGARLSEELYVTFNYKQILHIVLVSLTHFRPMFYLRRNQVVGFY